MGLKGKVLVVFGLLFGTALLKKRQNSSKTPAETTQRPNRLDPDVLAAELRAAEQIERKLMSRAWYTLASQIRTLIINIRRALDRNEEPAPDDLWWLRQLRLQAREFLPE